MDDSFLRLVELSRLSSPAHRTAQRSAGSSSAPPFRCPCGAPGAVDAPLITCARCGCAFHAECCRAGGGSECAFCGSAAAERLAAAGADPAALARALRDNEHSRVLPDASELSAALPGALADSAEWLRVLTARDDVYGDLCALAGRCVAPGSAADLRRELFAERALLQDAAEALRGLSEESAALSSPLLDALAADAASLRSAAAGSA